MIEYLEAEDLNRAVLETLKDPTVPAFESLRQSGAEFSAVLKVNRNADGEPVPYKDCPVATKKVSPMNKIWVKRDYLIVVDEAWWTTADATSQRFWLVSALLNVSAEKQADGRFKLSMRRPDIMLHSGAVHACPASEESRELFEKTARLSGGAAPKLLAPEKKAAGKQK